MVALRFVQVAFTMVSAPTAVPVCRSSAGLKSIPAVLFPTLAGCHFMGAAPFSICVISDVSFGVVPVEEQKITSVVREHSER